MITANVALLVSGFLTLSTAHADPTLLERITWSNQVPIEQTELSGRRLFGAFDIHRSEYCSPLAFSKIKMRLDPTTTKQLNSKDIVPDDRFIMDTFLILGNTKISTTYSAGGYVKQAMVDPINDVMNKLVKFGDRDVGNHFVCVGLYDFGFTNAVALPHGYILGSPEVPVKLNKMSEHDRTGFMNGFAFMHEFAHQLQFWTNEPAMQDKKSRRRELQADCVAAHLSIMHKQPLLSFLADDSSDAIAKNAAVWGDIDFESDNHHGTEYERYMMVRVGIRSATEWQRQHGLKNNDFTGLTARVMLDRCRALIDRRNAVQGENWKQGWDW